ncbi:MAG: hypothetical protein KKF12_08740 [Proteobacteria bacterium]|nr:hypothetical protein [Desulfobacula sp.]MBU3954679.1 hypothetical protein [Pseudomonadota bacterium]MBU4130893.1 hypothetical protein [Pseudomonadota bacterium]
MTIDLENSGGVAPFIADKIAVELIDYFCPFCNFKLFKGDVSDFNIVCSQCNKLVKHNKLSHDTLYPES